MEDIRKPVVAGYFYPGVKNQLIRLLKEFIPEEKNKEKVTAIISPHAGYVYSGRVAGLTYSKVAIPQTVIILGPNHTGYGEPYAVANHKKWETPLGEVELDMEIVESLTKKSRYLVEDNIAHEREHSIEVQVPFIQHIRKDVKIVPIVLSGVPDNPAWVEIGEDIAETINENKKEVLIVASTDMTHYESQKMAETKDKYALEAIFSLDEDTLIDRIFEKNISMCGYAPVIVSMISSKNLGAKEGILVNYSTSGDTSGDYESVVGYAGVIIK